MKSYLLLVVALLLFVICAPACLLTTLLRSIIRWKRVSFLTYTSESALSLALSIDLMGNVIGRDLLELSMTRNEPTRHRFGTYTETISSVLGHNKVQGTLTGLGRALAGLLNFIDPGHCERAAKLPTPSPHPLAVLVRSYLRHYWLLLAGLLGTLVLRIVLSVAGLLLLIATSSTAQVQPFDVRIFRGNSAERALLLNPADSLAQVTAKAYYAPGGRLLPRSNQPVIIRGGTAGTTVVVRFDSTLSLPEEGGYLQVSVAGQIRAAGRLIVTRITSGAGLPPVSVPPLNPQSRIVIYPVSGISSGHVITHNLGTKLVRVSAFWNDTGQFDALWFGVIDTVNSIHLWGPPTEYFTGNIVIEPLNN